MEVQRVSSLFIGDLSTVTCYWQAYSDILLFNCLVWVYSVYNDFFFCIVITLFYLNFIYLKTSIEKNSAYLQTSDGLKCNIIIYLLKK